MKVPTSTVAFVNRAQRRYSSKDGSNRHVRTKSSTSPTTPTIPPILDPYIYSTARWNPQSITLVNSSVLSFNSGLYITPDYSLYIADELSHHVVWKWVPASSTAILVAGVQGMFGSGASYFHNPQDVYVDSNQNLYVTDCLNNRIQKFSNGASVGSTIVGRSAISGLALNQFNCPRYFQFDASESFLYVADYYNDRVLRFSTTLSGSQNGTLVAGGNGGGTSNTQLYGPWGIAFNPSFASLDLYISNHIASTVMRWSPGASAGVVVAGRPGVTGGNSTLLNGPLDIRLDKFSNLYVVDNGNHRIQMFCRNTTIGITIAGTGVPGNSSTELREPRGIAFDSKMNLYVGDFANQRVEKFLKL